MELKDPKRKRWCHIELEQPFPIFIQSEVGVSIENWVAVAYTGIFNGYSVIVKDPNEISALHTMGNFGKGNCSRSRPEILKTSTKLPRIIHKQQYIHRRQWEEKDSVDSSTEQTPSSADKLLQDIAALHAQIDSLSDTSLEGTNDESVEILSTERCDVMDISSDDEITKHIELSDEVKDDADPLASGLAEKCSNKSDHDVEHSLDNLVFPLNSVVVISDSEIENEGGVHNCIPKLCIDNSDKTEYLVLTLQEAYFLAFGLGCLQILDPEEKLLNLKESWQLFCKTDPNFCNKYIVYHYYRSKGWIVKPGVKFGGDYLLYKEGQPYYHASYIIFINALDLQKQENFNWQSVLSLLRMAGTAAKEVIITQVTKIDQNEHFDVFDDSRLITKYKVSEILLRRWISNQERKEDEFH